MVSKQFESNEKVTVLYKVSYQKGVLYISNLPEIVLHKWYMKELFSGCFVQQIIIGTVAI